MTAFPEPWHPGPTGEVPEMVKHLDVRIDLGAESGQDARPSVQATEGRLAAIRDRIRETAPDGYSAQRAALLLDECGLLVELERMTEAWERAKQVFDTSVREKQWQSAAQACDLMFRSEQPLSLAALGQGIWLAVTFPIDPGVTVSLLEHVVDETPDHSDGAAIAAAVAVYVVDLRTEGAQYDDLSVSTRQLLTSVARRHRGVENQAELDAWVAALGLDDVNGILGRLRRIIEALVQDHWWIDRDSIQAELPDQ